MRAVYRAMPQWPYAEEPQQPIRFGFKAQGVTRDEALQFLGVELERIDASDVLIGVVTDPDNISLNGTLRRQTYYSAGVEVSFETPNGPLSFHTNAFRQVNANLYAIAKGLEALRLLERYGITQGGQQYEGWKALPAGDVVDAERGRQLVAAAGSIKLALKAAHPDSPTASDRDWNDIQAYAKSVGA